MLSYQQTAAPAILWPEPMELIWQMQPSVCGEMNPCWKRQDITLSERAFIGAVMNLPRVVRPSVGFLSQFIDQTGRRAGEILEQIDYSPLGDIILARDETYFNDLAFLICGAHCPPPATKGLGNGTRASGLGLG